MHSEQDFDEIAAWLSENVSEKYLNCYNLLINIIMRDFFLCSTN